MPKRSVDEMESLFQGALVGSNENFDREVEAMVALEAERILADIVAFEPGQLTKKKEVASYTSDDDPLHRYLVHSAMLAALRAMGRENEYYRASDSPIEGNGLPEHVRRNGWMLLLPMRGGSRPIFKFRPSDEGGGYRFSMSIYDQGNTSSGSSRRHRKKK